MMASRLELRGGVLGVAVVWALALVGVSLACSGGARYDVAEDDLENDLASALAADTLFTERVVVVVNRTADDIDAMRVHLDEEDFYTAADDANWYWAEAMTFLEERQYPVRQIEGRHPLYFMVAGEVRRYDLAEVELLDFFVMYDTDREPCILAAVDVSFAESYFTGVASEYGWDPCKEREEP